MPADPFSRAVADFLARKGFFQRLVGFHESVEAECFDIRWIDEDIDIGIWFRFVAGMGSEQEKP